uniref:hypothetical protein n=1 Tax=Pedobacter schmidteae TaxID=2201271 RepID=UPI0013CF069F|nr:hypothetical protein [Pedobacter schmidteae]
MKKNILYLVAFISVIFAACNPLKDEINNLNPPAAKTLAFTLTATDYGALPQSNYAQKGLYFATTDDAIASIPVILNSKYAQFGDGTKANIAYNSLPAQVKPADSVYANVQYTVTTSDYADAAPVVGNGTFKTYSVAQATAFLEWKYPKATSPVNKIVLLTYQFFQSNATPSAGVTVTEAFLLSASGWQKMYLISPAQYATLGRGINNAFTSADVPNFSSYFNALLKADPNVVSPKAGDVRYVSYKYQQSSTLIYQRVFATIFDGTNWGIKSVPVAPLSFLKKKGAWILDPTVYYTLVVADFAVLTTDEGKKIGSDAARANAIRFASFDVTGGQNNWTESEIMNVLLLILKTKYPNAPVDETVLYKITYGLFKGGVTPTEKSFIKTSAGFTLAPTE